MILRNRVLLVAICVVVVALLALMFWRTAPAAVDRAQYIASNRDALIVISVSGNDATFDLWEWASNSGAPTVRHNFHQSAQLTGLLSNMRPVILNFERKRPGRLCCPPMNIQATPFGPIVLWMNEPSYRSATVLFPATAVQVNAAILKLQSEEAPPSSDWTHGPSLTVPDIYL